jgi:hypothetical protein
VDAVHPFANLLWYLRWAVREADLLVGLDAPVRPDNENIAESRPVSVAGAVGIEKRADEEEAFGRVELEGCAGITKGETTRDER